MPPSTVTVTPRDDGIVLLTADRPPANAMDLGLLSDIAGGLVLALRTDVRVAAAGGRYGLTEVKVGVPYPQAAIGVVRAELSPGAARVLALGNRLVSAEECLRLGVFDEVVEPEAVAARALEVARELAAMPSEIYARTKRELRGRTIEALRAAVADDPLLEGWVP